MAEDLNELSNEAKHLAIRFYVGEITEVQFNFLANQKQFNKEAMLSFIESVRKTRKILFAVVVVGLLVAFFIMPILSILGYFLFRR